jgi:hypothetical protein
MRLLPPEGLQQAIFHRVGRLPLTILRRQRP